MAFVHSKTFPPQPDFLYFLAEMVICAIHDTIQLLKDDVALGVGISTPYTAPHGSHVMAQQLSAKTVIQPHFHITSFHMVADRRRSAMSSIVHTIVPLVMEEVIEVARSILQEHIHRRTVEVTVDVLVPRYDDNNDQLSNTDARNEAVEKSMETEARQRQHPKVVILIANNAAETELLSLALNRLHGTQEHPAQTLVNAEQLIEVRSVVPVPSFPLCGCKFLFF